MLIPDPLQRGLFEQAKMRNHKRDNEAQNRGTKQENPSPDLCKTDYTEASILVPSLVCKSTDIWKWIKIYAFIH